MLLVIRRKGESLVIEDRIIVTVFEIRQDHVELAVVAPRGASVHRREVFDAIHGGRCVDPSKPAPALAGMPAAPLAFRRELCLDRLAAALEVRTGVPVSLSVLKQAVLDAAVQELGTDPAG